MQAGEIYDDCYCSAAINPNICRRHAFPGMDLLEINNIVCHPLLIACCSSIHTNSENYNLAPERNSEFANGNRPLMYHFRIILGSFVWIFKRSIPTLDSRRIWKQVYDSQCHLYFFRICSELWRVLRNHLFFRVWCIFCSLPRVMFSFGHCLCVGVTQEKQIFFHPRKGVVQEK